MIIHGIIQVAYTLLFFCLNIIHIYVDIKIYIIFSMSFIRICEAEDLYK